MVNSTACTMTAVRHAGGTKSLSITIGSPHKLITKVRTWTLRWIREGVFLAAIRVPVLSTACISHVDSINLGSAPLRLILPSSSFFFFPRLYKEIYFVAKSSGGVLDLFLWPSHRVSRVERSWHFWLGDTKVR